MRTCPESRYHDELNAIADRAAKDRKASYYAAHKRVLVAELRVSTARAALSRIDAKLAYATGTRNEMCDKLMGLTGVTTSSLLRDYASAAHALEAARLHLEEIK